jgi:hypothetical protein
VTTARFEQHAGDRAVNSHFLNRCMHAHAHDADRVMG